jgi:hypothetical protein
MTKPPGTKVLTLLRDLFTSKTTLAWRLALLEPTTQLARMLAGYGTSWHEICSRSTGMPHGGLCSHCSREASRAQADEPGGTLHATPTVSR